MFFEDGINQKSGTQRQQQNQENSPATPGIPLWFEASVTGGAEAEYRYNERRVPVHAIEQLPWKLFSDRPAACVIEIGRQCQVRAGVGNERSDRCQEK